MFNQLWIYEYDFFFLFGAFERGQSWSTEKTQNNKYYLVSTSTFLLIVQCK